MAKEIPPELIEKVTARRGRRHAFSKFEGRRTALVVIDFTRASVQADPSLLDIARPVNNGAAQVRDAGGTVAWVRPAPEREHNKVVVEVVGVERAAAFADEADPENPLSQLWEGLDVHHSDLHATKSGWSAFFPGKCDVQPQLASRGIENVLIAGTVTSVCCESSARDAVELGYRVTMLSDANAGHGFGLHEASLSTFFRIFGDVRPTSDLAELLTRP